MLAACEGTAEVYVSAEPAGAWALPNNKECFYEFCRGDGDVASVVPPGYCHCECATGGAMTFETPWPPSADCFMSAEAERQALCPNAK
jgi:hypothetical protein